MELSGFALSPLREGPFTLHRGLGDGPESILLVAAAGEDPSPGSFQRLEHEYALRTDLDGDWAARPVELLPREGRLVLVLADPGGEPLERLLGRPLEVAEFLRIAVPLAAAVGQLHARGLIHKDLKPANILVDTASGSVWLTGFGIASRLPREHLGPAPPEVIAGTLAYMAPEQTGRMNRSIDTRSDLYSLGITFYEMLTGVLPFAASDPMEWVHCHVARLPMPPGERVTGIPDPVAAIVLKLLAKTAEDRYQTAAGLEADLRRCLAAWQAQHRIDAFPLGARDASDRLLIREKLYGREAETEALTAAFDRVVAGGATELVLVFGHAGIGKSSLVNELHKALVPPRGLFAAGKFDQYKRNIPYTTLAQAFQGLIQQILGKSDSEMSQWRSALLDALGPNGQLMVNLIPELALIIGEQPSVLELAPEDWQNRFQLVFRRFLGVFASPEHPLVLFLDDLQWLDTATLDLIEHLVGHPEVRHLLLVGAYRHNEVSSSHPLMQALAKIRHAGHSWREIMLAPLTPEDVEQLIADALHTERGAARSLSDLVFEKTDGNPFFTIQFLTAIAEEALLDFDPGTAAWTWDLTRIRARGFTDNVADLMTAKLNRLPDETQRALGLLACLGNVAETTTLALVHGEAEEALHVALWEAVRAGLVLRTDGAYTFLHDRIQEAAYALIAEGERAMVHLRIGRLLAARATSGEPAENIFDIVNQFDRGVALITAEEERELVANLNLMAGKRAKAASAYTSALRYLTTGRDLLAENGWQRRYRSTFDLEFNLAECEYLTGAFASAQKRLSTLSIRAQNIVDFAAVTWVRLNLYTNLDQSDRAVEVGLDYLRQVDRQWSLHATAEDVRQGYDKLWERLGPRSIEALLDLPFMTDPDRRATMDVLTALASPALFTDEHLFRLVVCRMASLSLDHGNSDGSCLAYVWLGGVLGTYFGDYQAGFRFGRLGLDLVEKRGLDRFSARVYLVFAVHVAPWTQHLRTSYAFLRRAFKAAEEAGDLSYAAYSCIDLITNRFATGDTLDEVEREAEKGFEFARTVWFGLASDCITGQLRLIRMLRGLTTDFTSFNDASFNEERFEQHLESNPQLAIGACWYGIRKLQASVYAGDRVSAILAASKVARLLWTAPTQFELAEYHFYGALARAAHCDMISAEARLQQLEVLAAHHQQLALWAHNCPETFANRAALVGAEIARLEARELDAERLYEEAIQLARKHGFIQNEGLGNELAARFYATRGFETIAHAYLRNARSCYLRWGALGKVRQLERFHPKLLEDATPRPPAATVGTPVEQLDIGAVLKASQAVSSEIVLDRLVETLMTIALEHAGAERGLLILLRGDTLQIEAEARTSDKTIEVTLRHEPVAAAALPEAVLHTVIRTQHSVILDDASAQGPFAADAYVRQTHARSVLCLPLVKQAKLIGVLYLENNLASHVFTPARISVLELLASQAAISLENAGLYAELQVSEDRWRKLFENVPVGVTLTGSDGRYVAVNQTFQRMTGYSEAELCNLSPVDITHEDDRTATEEILVARATSTPYPQRHEKRYRRKDGSVIWVDGSAFVAPVVSGVPLFAAVVVDITDRKRAEEQLRRSEASLAQAQQISRTGSWRWNVGTGEVRWSIEHFRIFSLDPLTARPSFATFMERIHPEDRPSFEHALDQAVRDRSRFQHEYRLALPDGSVKYLQSVGQPDRSWVRQPRIRGHGDGHHRTQARRGDFERRPGGPRSHGTPDDDGRARRLTRP